MDVSEAIDNNLQIRKYTNEKPPIEDIVEIIETANKTFTHGNVHILSFTLIDDPDIIKDIATGCQQSYIEKAPYVIVITSNDKQAKKLFDKRATKYIKHHAGAAAQIMLLKARDLGLAGSWIGAFSDPTIEHTIGSSGEIELILTLGYGMNEKGTKSRQRKKPELTGRLFFNVWGNRFYKPLKKLRRGDM
jgi:nitroreductase